MAENQRVRLTKRLLKEALIRMLRTQKIEEVTIKGICEEAQINRTTFYKYYGSEHDLLSEIEQEALESLNDSIGKEATPYATIIKLLSYIDNNTEMFQMLSDNNINPDFANKIFDFPKIYVAIVENTKNRYTDKQIKKIITFITHGGYALIKEWIDNGKRESIDQIANTLIAIISKILQ